jgi:hypothetical protein
VQVFHRLSNPVKGMLASALAFFLFSTSDVLHKTLTTDYHVITLGFFAAVGCIVFYNTYALVTRQWRAMMTTRALHLHALRGLCFAAINMSFLYGITHLTLANMYT